VIVAVFIRRLKEGMKFEDFKRAWEADKGFGVPTRVFSVACPVNGRSAREHRRLSLRP
jgi:hypothetical protein